MKQAGGEKLPEKINFTTYGQTKINNKIRNYKSKYKTKMRNSLKSNQICFLNAFIDTQTREKSSKQNMDSRGDIEGRGSTNADQGTFRIIITIFNNNA